MSGGWTDPGTLELELDVIFLETALRLMLTCSPRERTFHARWGTRPLGSFESLSRLGPCRVLAAEGSGQP